MINKKELWTFCHQYGMEPIRAPSAKKKKIIKKQNKTERRIYKKPYTKKYNKTPQESKPHRKPKYKKLKKIIFVGSVVDQLIMQIVVK